MPNKMIIDASHPEETRVVVLRGNRVEEFDFESANKKPLRGNIYLAKVTRVEPSLQAAFVDYGGNRHGFLAFSEIHPDYYQIPVADRQALLEEDARAHGEDEGEEPKGERRSRRHRRSRAHEAELRARGEERLSAPAEFEENLAEAGASEGEAALAPPEPTEPPADAVSVDTDSRPQSAAAPGGPPDLSPESLPADLAPPTRAETGAPDSTSDHAAEGAAIAENDQERRGEEEANDDRQEVTTLDGGAEVVAPSARLEQEEEEGEPVEQVGGDAMEELPRRPPRLRRQYKIQEVIKRRQVLLVQVVKEERGNKGAALTTYLSLAGRYSVLMPNTARGGGISRKITNSVDRSRLKTIAQELEVPEGMGVILRTAGAMRTKAEVKRDFEYLLRMWETVRELTLASTAPTLVYEEGSLIKRAIRDLYNKDIDEVVVAGEEGYREAKEFMRLLMPSHAKNVQPYRDSQPVFVRAGVEAQLDAMFSNQVTLKSGGYIVINQTEALVAIDVNSGRSTREHNIEDTALRTNLEAADEIARQLRLRDLAGLIVVDFIDMEEGRNNRAVERRMKDALKNDRARIQVGRISHFGLLEMSRQRIRSGVLEGSTVVCPHCLGAGVVRSTASIALHVLRVLEDSLIKSATHDLTVRTRSEVALYILNQKRSHLRDLESRFGVSIMVTADDTLTGSTYHAIERGELATGPKMANTSAAEERPASAEEAADEALAQASPDEDAELEGPSEGAREPREDKEAPEAAHGEAARRRRRRRRRRGGGQREAGEGLGADAPQPTDSGLAAMAELTDYVAPAAANSVGKYGDRPAPSDEEASGRSRHGSRWRRGRREHRREPRFEETEPNDTREAQLSAAPQSEAEPRAPEERWAPAESPPAPAEAARPEAPVLQVEGSTDSEAASPLEGVGETPATAPTVSPPTEPAEEPDQLRPKRSGWWQRARAGLVGE
ncbi:MAG TPA: Rne/Rng family ribonuclease [Roseiarcus sp.]|nr:Rne/Rng family ribonuclease [Roseiarcus sp.]